MGIEQDVRFALLGLRKRPVTSAVIVLTLGLGIGANGVFFAAQYGSALRPLPFEDPERLVMLHQSRPALGETRQGVSALNLRDWLAETSVFTGAASYVDRSYNLQSDAEPARIAGAAITAELFPLLGVEPRLGRNVLPEEDRPGGPLAALISHDVWTDRFGGDPDVVGRTLRLDDRVHEVVGVMPEDFHFSNFGQVWTPLQLEPTTARRDRLELSVVARLRSGVTAGEAQVALAEVAERLQSRYPETNSGWSAEVFPLREAWMPSGGGLGLFAMATQMTLVTGLLLIVCANVTNVILAQATARRREWALRAALGAGRGRLVVHALVESSVLALLGGLLGVSLALESDLLLRSVIPIPLPYWLDLSLEGHGLAYIAGLSVLTAVVIGLLPALRATRGAMLQALTSSGGGEPRERGRLRRALVIGEYAVALVILVAGLLMVRGFESLRSADRGFHTEDVLTLSVPLTGDAYDEEPSRAAYFEAAVRRLDALPETDGVGVTNALPYLQVLSPSLTSLAAEGLDFAAGEEPRAAYHSVSSGLFAALGLPELAGRTFTRQESFEGADVVIVSQSVADVLWPGQSPLGRRLRLLDDLAAPWLEIVGVVGDIEPGQMVPGLGSMPRHRIYLPLAGTGSPSAFDGVSRIASLVVASRIPPAALVPRVRGELGELDAAVPLFEVKTMEQVLDEFYFAQHFWSRVYAIIAVLGLAIAAIGVYGITAYATGQRVREMGIRSALGASPPALLALVLRQGLQLAAVGLALGLVVALPLAYGLGELVAETRPAAPGAFAMVIGLLLGTSLLASYLPGRAAAAADPIVALREE